ncbi:hypothetical protein V5N11_007010 [Cardamine amara subsp. amara]|uniref:RNase H type-1 domain-containing protein n=1 Tax=Cardamine amara subsp. amara TaxID=228776 RepID=A0ABD1AKY2_CARAN
MQHWRSMIQILGAAWVLRDESGQVRLHSRRAFSRIETKDEANLCATRWAVGCMRDHHINQIIFAAEVAELVGVINRPKTWSSYAFHRADLLVSLQNIRDWKFTLETHSSNRGVSLIAQSVVTCNHLLSYVAFGASFWLIDFFDNERPLASGA